MTPVLRLLVLGACALTLSGCISLLPKSKPAQLYRFGQTATAEAPRAPSPGEAQATGGVGVFRANGTFARESASDRLLTITGEKAAYVAGARWVAPATVLFDQAVLSAFDAAPGKVRLLARGEATKSAYALRLDVRNFEAHYDSGPSAAPTVVVRVRAVLSRQQDSALVGETIFEASVRARDNRVGAIIEAYDKALAEVLSELVGWTERLST
jgi:cholesterol transport system auxiliary component